MANRKMYVQPEVSVADFEPETMLAGSGGSTSDSAEIGHDEGQSDTPQIEKSVWD